MGFLALDFAPLPSRPIRSFLWGKELGRALASWNKGVVTFRAKPCFEAHPHKKMLQELLDDHVRTSELTESPDLFASVVGVQLPEVIKPPRQFPCEEVPGR